MKITLFQRSKVTSSNQQSVNHRKQRKPAKYQHWRRWNQRKLTFFIKINDLNCCFCCCFRLPTSVFSCAAYRCRLPLLTQGETNRHNTTITGTLWVLQGSNLWPFTCEALSLDTSPRCDNLRVQRWSYKDKNNFVLLTGRVSIWLMLFARFCSFFQVEVQSESTACSTSSGTSQARQRQWRWGCFHRVSNWPFTQELICNR